MRACVAMTLISSCHHHHHPHQPSYAILAQEFAVAKLIAWCAEQGPYRGRLGRAITAPTNATTPTFLWPKNFKEKTFTRLIQTGESSSLNLHQGKSAGSAPGAGRAGPAPAHAPFGAMS